MNHTYLGIELGSTRIKAVAIDEKHTSVSSGDYTWKSNYDNGIWTYDLSLVWEGLKTALGGRCEPGKHPCHGHFRHDARLSGL